ncbi:MAG TPA: hypothetical protein VLA52_13145 [Thermohalobaculum sp.]|nr:hypothetical protein [Thermohalobaculum sp.]
MSEVETVSQGTAIGTGEYDPLASLNDGFLGTGYSTGVELSFLVLALIVAGIVIAMLRYLLSGKRVFWRIAEAMGLT